MSTPTQKTLAPGQARFIAKQQGLAKSSPWRVYDAARGSWPASSMEVGQVKQDCSSQDEAQAEADRCNRVLASRG